MIKKDLDVEITLEDRESSSETESEKESNLFDQILEKKSESFKSSEIMTSSSEELDGEDTVEELPRANSKENIKIKKSVTVA